MKNIINLIFVLFFSVGQCQSEAIVIGQQQKNTSIEGEVTPPPNPILAEVTGDLRQYHKTTLTLNNPNVVFSESPSTYLNYRLNVTFTSPTGSVHVVPGYFAADGNASETSATSGAKWRAHINVEETGTWTYAVSFRTGANIAASTVSGEGTAISFDGITGSFNIVATNKTGNDFRAKGKLQYVGKPAAQFDNGDYYYEVGADSPETFLEYADFDATTARHDYAEVASNYVSGDPSWQSGKGTEIIGAVNYLANQGMNVHYFLTNNITGDGARAYPFPTNTAYQTYDVSKLDQWQIVFDHMYNKGIVQEIVFLETENLNWFEDMESIDISEFSVSRKVYYREMIARFGYNNVIWNIGEEANWTNGTDVYTAAQIEEAAVYINSITPYNDLVTVHNGPSTDFTLFPALTALSGTTALTSISFQGDAATFSHGHNQLLTAKNLAITDGREWVVRYSEPYASSTPNLETWTNNALWASITAGSVGTHYYAATLDVTGDNYTSYATYYQRMKYAYDFLIDNNIPFWNMENNTSRISAGTLLTDDTDNFVVFLPTGGTATLDLDGSNTYNVKWFNPRAGGALQNGSVTSISSGTNVALGTAPSTTTSSWVICVKRIGIGTTVPVTSVTINTSSPSIAVGETSQVLHTVNPSNASNKSVTWASSNTGIFTVSSTGIITGVAIGSATLTVTTVDGSFTDTETVTVTAAPLAQYEEIGNLVVIEAENILSPSTWTTETAATGYTGSGYLRWGQGEYFTTPGNGLISIKIKINSTGIYQFRWRTKIGEGTSTTDENDSWVRFPDAALQYATPTASNENGTKIYPYGSGLTPNPNGAGSNNWWKVYSNTIDWNWTTHTSDNTPNRIYVRFDTPGIYTMQISARSNYHFLDRIVLFKSSVSDAMNLSKTETLYLGTIADTTPPSNPTSATASSIGISSATLTWTASTDNVAVTNYRVYNGSTLIKTEGNVATSTVTGLSDNTAYNLTIRAVDAAGNESGNSNNISFTTLQLPTGNVYPVDVTSTVSIGVYDDEDNLLRTLTSLETKTPGTYSPPAWNGLNDNGVNVAAQGSKYKVLIGNLNWTPMNTVGNNSNQVEGYSKWARFRPVRDMIVIGGTAYCAFGYSEGHMSIAAFNLSTPRDLIELETQKSVYPAFLQLAYDGTHLYAAGASARASTQGVTYFSKMTLANIANHNNWESLQGQTYTLYSSASTYKVGNYLYEPDAHPDTELTSGIAVQTGNENLYLAREYNNTITVINKSNGVIKQVISTYTKPKHLKIDVNGALWFVHGDTEVVEKFTINNSTGSLTSTGITITGYNNINAIDLNADASIIAIADVGVLYDQIFAHNTTTEALIWTLGRTENYAQNPNVYNDKFMFKKPGDKIWEYGYISFLPDGSFWVNDLGNSRQLKFNASRVFETDIMWIQGFYNCFVDNANPNRVFASFYEFFDEALEPATGGNVSNSWRLVRNYGASSKTANILGDKDPIDQIITLSNNRTYAVTQDANSLYGQLKRFFEVDTITGLRDTGVTYSNSGNLRFLPNDKIERTSISGGIQSVLQANVTFSSAQNPIIGSFSTLGSWSTSGLYQNDSGGGLPGQYTTSGLRAVFFGQNRSEGSFHVGGYSYPESKFKFQTYREVIRNNTDPYFFDNTFDARPMVTYHARGAWAVDDIIVGIYHGEFWRNVQTNYFHWWHESGLPLAITGDNRLAVGFSYADPKNSGNGFSLAISKINSDKIIIRQNDENVNGGINKYMLSGLDTVQLIEIPLP